MDNLTTHRIKVVTASGTFEHSYSAITAQCWAVESASTDDKTTARCEASARRLIFGAVTKQDRSERNSQIRARAFAAIVLIDYITRRTFAWGIYILTCWRKPEQPRPADTEALRMQTRMCAEENTNDYRAAWQAKMDRWLAAHPITAVA